VLTLEPVATRANNHGQLQGVAFSADGWLYVGRGAHVGGAYTWVGTDGRQIPGFDDGGDIVRIRPDGTQLERVARGFWNPFGLAIDRQGRVVSIDNDPDARGPNRLMHIVPGGDYGFKNIFGHLGLHPYLAWEGDLPGTLPLIGGVGEAPTAVIDTSLAALPATYQDAFLVSVWGEHNLSLYRPQAQGASMRGTRETFLQGAQSFRPSGLATAPDGTIYVMDWMLLDYAGHGRGRVWKVSAKPGVATVAPRQQFAPPRPSPAFARLATLRASSTAADYESLRAALTEDDPFVRSTAVDALTKPVFRDAVLRDVGHANARVRLGALLALREANLADPRTAISRFLADADLEVVQMALVWTGEKVLKSVAKDVDAIGLRPNLTKRLFETWIATVQILQHPDLEAYYAAGRSGMSLRRDLSPETIDDLARSASRPVALRAMAMRWLTDIDKPATHTFLTALATAGDPALQVEAVRLLSGSKLPDTTTLLRTIAHDRARTPTLRAEALLSLTEKADGSLLPLLDDPSPIVRLQAARSLRRAIDDPTVRTAATRKLTAIRGSSQDARLANQLEFLLGTERAARPTTLEGWQKMMATGGDADAGRRVFFSANSACNACHLAEARGRALGTAFTVMPYGPDLSAVGRTANRNQLVRSIVRPADEIVPEYQGWEVRTTSGQVHTGLQIDQPGNAITLIGLDGTTISIPRATVASWGAMAGSLMLEGQHLAMSTDEFRDLVAYLESLK
jgi:putative heme-binding domain-containing protein